METFSALLAICTAGEAGDLRHHRAHYDVIVMKYMYIAVKVSLVIDAFV